TKLRQAIDRLGIKFPVEVDDKQKLWRDYLCDLWPSQFVIDRAGIVRYSHGGVGRYEDMEKAVQDLLKSEERGRFYRRINATVVFAGTPRIMVPAGRVSGFRKRNGC